MANVEDLVFQLRSRWFCLAPKKTPLEQIVHVAPEPNNQHVVWNAIVCILHCFIGCAVGWGYRACLVIGFKCAIQSKRKCGPGSQLCVWPKTTVNVIFLCCWKHRLTKFDLVLVNIWGFRQLRLNISHTDHCWVMWMGIHLSLSTFVARATWAQWAACSFLRCQTALVSQTNSS